jgi:O-antigen/teichoic acid export membrane protein
VSDLKKKFLYQTGLAISQLLFPLITYPWLTRVLGPEGLGKTGYIEFTAGLIFTLFSIGISYYGVREIAKERNNKEKRSQLIGEILSIHIVSMVIGIAIFCIIVFSNKNFNSERELIGLASVYILAQVFAMEWYMQGLERFRFIAIRNILIRIAGLAAILLFVRTKADYVFYFGIVTVTQLLVSIITIVHVLAENKVLLFKGPVTQHLKPLSWLFLTSSFISIYVYFDTIILGFLTDDKTVGYYTVAIKIVKLPLLLLLTFNTILFPRISFLNTEIRTSEIQRLYRLSIEFIFTFTLPVCMAIYFLAPEIIQLIAGTGFIPSVDVLKILATLPFIICITNFLVLQLLIPLHKEKNIVAAVLVGSFCSVILLFVLIPGMREKGAAWATLVTEFFVMLICVLYSWSLIKQSIPVKTFLTSFLFSLLIPPAVWLARDLFPSPFLILGSVTITIGLSYFLLQYFVGGNVIIKDCIAFMKRPFRGIDEK